MKQSIINTKKGVQLNQAFGAVLMLVLIAVLIIVAILLFSSLGKTFNTIPASVTNESVAWLNQSGYPLDDRNVCGFSSLSITNIVNATASQSGSVPEDIPSANYTVQTGNTIINATDTTYSEVNLSYDYLNGGKACTATQTMITQFGTYPALVGLVGTIIFLGIVIGVLVASFVFGRRRDGV